MDNNSLVSSSTPLDPFEPIFSPAIQKQVALQHTATRTPIDKGERRVKEEVAEEERARKKKGGKK
jgi:hypothetical protein